MALSNKRPNPIKNFAESGKVELKFPAGSHPMSRWKDRKKHFELVGTFGDEIDFRGLPTSLQTKAMAEKVGAATDLSDVKPTSSGAFFEACGSPGETANKPAMGHIYFMPGEQENSIAKLELDDKYEISESKSQVWMNVVFKARDQLRQRVAWALAQIFTVGINGVSKVASHFFSDTFSNLSPLTFHF